jgi:hypothetical protein
MRKELDELLCAKYPKIFRDRNAPMNQTCMCWGFDCGDGWFNIIDRLCANIQSHIANVEQQREHTIKWNNQVNDPDYDWSNKASFIKREERPVPELLDQVVAIQVKEKFGTLRFYYNGGDDFINGLERMAESMSAVTCEECGSPGTRTTGGWIRTLCETHKKEE